MSMSNPDFRKVTQDICDSIAHLNKGYELLETVFVGILSGVVNIPSGLEREIEDYFSENGG